MDESATSTKVKTIPNPTGAGGFKDHPENIAPHGWKKENSQKYLLNDFLHMNEDAFIQWGNTHPKHLRTVAQVIAYEHVKKARNTLNEYKEITNRTEGMPVQPIEQSGELKIEIGEMLNKVYGQADDTSENK